jgi:hypothetical protein
VQNDPRRFDPVLVVLILIRFSKASCRSSSGEARLLSPELQELATGKKTICSSTVSPVARLKVI